MRLFLIGGMLALQVAGIAQQNLPALIPAPVEMQVVSGTCDLLCPWEITGQADPALLELLREELPRLHPSVTSTCATPFRIQFDRTPPDPMRPAEWYALSVSPTGILVTAPTDEGLFRGSRTVVQLLEQGRASGRTACLSITDHPRFPYRGMHLDVCRHFFPVEFVKRYIDLLARYKMNTFHWHLTEDQAWRIEIKKHPRLTEVGGHRRGSQIGPYSRREYDSIPYGGFYTQEQVREVVAHAQARHIRVVPEIEMPGHALAALAAYPHLGCTGGPYEVERGWGVFEDVFCAGNDSVFDLLTDVINEVVELFPGPYIHLGGDECPKDRWKTCAKCQARMRNEGLKDEHELQSYFIRRMERVVNGHGRRIIGWDEILEGGLAPNATVMSWQGTEGGTAAAKAGHDAIMTPGSHCYFDHYQGPPVNEPLAFGGFTPLQKVYAYEPVPEGLTDTEARHILGAQGNLWTEYILAPEQAEYMALPRLLALSEVVWSPRERRDEADFLARLEQEFPQMDALGVRYATSLYTVDITPKQGRVPGSIDVHLSCGMEGVVERQCQCLSAATHAPDADAEGRCNMEALRNGATCTARVEPYTGPMTLDRDTRVTATLRRPHAKRSDRAVRTFRFNKATARPITLSTPPHERYTDGGAFTLVDGITAQQKRVNTEWLGWREGVTVTVDLGSVQALEELSIGALNETYGWIHLPRKVAFSVSADGRKYTSAGSAERSATPAPGVNRFVHSGPIKARFVRFTVTHQGPIPAGYPGAGSPAWMFLDEVEIR